MNAGATRPQELESRQSPFDLNREGLPGAILLPPRAGSGPGRPTVTALSLGGGDTASAVCLGTSRGLVARLKLDPPTAASYRVLQRSGERVVGLEWVDQREVALVRGREGHIVELLSWSDLDTNYANSVRLLLPGGGGHRTSAGPFRSVRHHAGTLVVGWERCAVLWRRRAAGHHSSALTAWVCEFVLRPPCATSSFTCADISEKYVGLLSGHRIMLWERSNPNAEPSLLTTPSAQKQLSAKRFCELTTLRGLSISKFGAVAATEGPTLHIWNMLGKSRSTLCHSSATQLPDGMKEAVQVSWLSGSIFNTTLDAASGSSQQLQDERPSIAVLGNDGSLLICAVSVGSDYSVAPAIKLEVRPPGGVSLFSSGGNWLACVSREPDEGLRLYDIPGACRAHQVIMRKASSHHGVAVSPTMYSTRRTAPRAMRSGSNGAGDNIPRGGGEEENFSSDGNESHGVGSRCSPQYHNCSDLRSLLRSRGSFPCSHRVAAWRSLLSLPYNHAAFADFVSRGTHPAYKYLADSFPIRSHRTLKRLQVVCSALAHWSPQCAEAEHLPEFVFPFVKVFGVDLLGAFETIVTLILRFGKTVFLTFPAPSTQLLMAVTGGLKKNDAILYNHLQKHGLSAHVYGWGLLRSAFSEVLDRRGWLVLWDHIMAAAERSHTASILFSAAVAVSLAMSSTLLSLEKRDDIVEEYHKCGGPEIELVLKIMYSIEPSNNGGGEEGKAGAKHRSPKKGSKELLGVPKGMSYPTFEAAANSVEDFQLEERRLVMREQLRADLKRSLLKELSLRVDELGDPVIAMSPLSEKSGF